MFSMGPENSQGTNWRRRRAATDAPTPNLRTRPILDAGMFHADGIQMTPLELHLGTALAELKFAEFDVSEMSMSSMLMLIASGDDRFIGLPIFSTHYFFQNWISIRKDAGERKEDLAGHASACRNTNKPRRLSRGNSGTRIRCGSQDMEFLMERTPDISHGGSTGFELPEGVTVHRISPKPTCVWEKCC